MTTVKCVLEQIDSLIARPLETESVPMDQALHRILRESIVATEDQPPFHRSSIDGYLTHPDQAAGKSLFLRPVCRASPSQSFPPWVPPSAF